MRIRSSKPQVSVAGVTMVALAMVLPLSVGSLAADPLDERDQEKAAEFRLPTLEGGKVSSEELRGKVVLIDLWATWCPPCLEMIPILEAMHEKYAEKGLAVVGVSLDEEGPSVVDPFVREQGIGYTIAFPNDAFLKGYGPIEAIPMLFVLDREGKIRKRFVGFHRRQKLEALVSSLLEEKPSPPAEGLRLEFGPGASIPCYPPASPVELDRWIRGTALTTEALRGKVVLLDFFQIVCPGCRAVHPHIVDLWKRYRERGLEVIGVAVAFELLEQQTPEKIRRYVKENDFPYPVAIDRGLRTTFDRYEARGTPFVALIDRGGRVRHLDFYRPKRVEAQVRQLLDEEAGE